jgi:hypothetical protein
VFNGGQPYLGDLRKLNANRLMAGSGLEPDKNFPVFIIVLLNRKPRPQMLAFNRT